MSQCTVTISKPPCNVWLHFIINVSFFSFSEGGCGDPGTPENGRKLGVTYSVNSVVYFNCDLGYELVGSPDRKCLLNGTWTGTHPVCKGVV